MRVRAAPQPVMRVTRCREHGRPSTCCARPTTWATATWRWKCKPTTCSSSPTTCWPTCCAQMHLIVTEVEAPFEPEAGAYATTQAHGHDHAHARHDHDHGPASVTSIDASGAAPLLQLLWLASPALPVGGFSYSEGLEAAIEAGSRADESSAAAWLLDQLHAVARRAPTCAVAGAGHRGLAAPRRRAHRGTQRLGAPDARDAELRAADRADGPLDARMAAPARPGDARLALLASCARAHLAGGLRAGGRAERRARARRAAGLRLRLGREHGAGGDQGRAARPERAASASCSALTDALPGRRRRRAGPARQRAPGLHADAGHPVGATRNPVLEAVPIMTQALLHHIPGRTTKLPPLRVGVGGPVGSGKTTLVEMLCKAMRERWDLVVVTNDIYTKEDQRLLTVAGALRRRAHHGRRDRRLPAHRDPRGRLDQPRGGRPHAGEVSRTPTSSSSSPAATTWPPPSAPSWPT